MHFSCRGTSVAYNTHNISALSNMVYGRKLKHYTATLRKHHIICDDSDVHPL